MRSYQTFKKQLLKDKVIQQAYDESEPEFMLVQKLIERRLKQGLTQVELAKKIGTKQTAISRLESGTYNPTIGFLNKVAAALNVKLTISFS